MIKILFSLILICTAIEASKHNLPNREQTSPQRSTAVTNEVTADGLIQMHRYFKSTYYPLIEALRERKNVTRDDILRAYSRDLFLNRVHDGGHGTFVHKILPLKFGVIAHGSGDINVDERQAHHAVLQVYVNVIKLFLQPLLDIHHAITDLDSMSSAEWKQAYGVKLNDAAIAFNAMTSADWNERIKAQAAAFEEYSRD